MVHPAAKASVKMEEAAPAAMGGDGHWPAVLDLVWWQGGGGGGDGSGNGGVDDGGGGASDGGGGCGGGGGAAAAPGWPRMLSGVEPLRTVIDPFAPSQTVGPQQT